MNSVSAYTRDHELSLYLERKFPMTGTCKSRHASASGYSQIELDGQF